MEVKEVIKKTIPIISLILVIISICGLYFAFNELINIWISYKYAPIYRILLNLGILILAAYVLNKSLKSSNKEAD